MQDASIMSATKSMKEVRALGAMERLFLLMDQNHPAHLTVTAEVKGFAKVQSWRDAVQKRHPVLSTSIHRNEEGQPTVLQVDAAPIPLRVLDGSVPGALGVGSGPRDGGSIYSGAGTSYQQRAHP